MGCHLLVTCVIQIFLALSGAKTIEESRTEALLAVPEPPKNCSDPKYKTSISLDPPAFTPKELEDARKAALDRHNYYRALHDVPLLTRSLVVKISAYHLKCIMLICCFCVFSSWKQGPFTSQNVT